MMLHVFLSFKLVISSSEAGPVLTDPDRFTEPVLTDPDRFTESLNNRIITLASMLFQNKQTKKTEHPHQHFVHKGFRTDMNCMWGNEQL